MIKVRQDVFETNSSSSHSFVKCNSQTWEDFKNGKLYFNTLSKSNGFPVFCTWKEVKAYISSLSHKNELEREMGINFFMETFYSFDELDDYTYFESKEEARLDYYFG